jgi:ABC-2 type transport system permease protein
MASEVHSSRYKELKKVFYFVQRDMRILFTYRIAFFSMFTSIFFSLFNLVLFGAMFGVTELTSLTFYGGNYISYIIIGSIGWGFMWAIAGATSNALRSEMAMGTLEAVMSTPTRMTTLVLSYTIYGLIFGFISIIVTVFVGIGLFGMGMLGTLSLATVVIFVLMVVMMAGIGMTFGGLTIWSKNVDQLIGISQSVAMFFSGVYFPISVLPSVLRPVSNVMPFLYPVEGLRRSLIPGASDVWVYAAITAAVSLSLLSVGYLVLRHGIRKAKRDGSLSYY